MQNPRGSLVDQNYNLQNQMQKTSSIPRYERNNLNNSHSERSIRGNQKNEIQINPLDIWVRSDPLFQSLPTKDDIDKICDKMTIDNVNLAVNDRPFRKQNLNEFQSYHWSERLNEIVQASQKDSKKSSSGRQLLRLPQPPPAPNDISKYWINQTPSFPISDAQKKNRSIVHCLLSAFVEAEPDDPSQNNDIVSNYSESDTESGFNEDNDDLLSMHAPVPQIEYDEYLCLPFEKRLEIELQFAGLEKPSYSMENSSNLFAPEIEQIKKEMANLQPQIEFYKNDIKQNLPQYRILEERRKLKQQNYQDLIHEFKKKPHKK